MTDGVPCESQSSVAEYFRVFDVVSSIGTTMDDLKFDFFFKLG